MAKYRKKPVVVEAVKVSDVMQNARWDWAGLPQWIKDEYEKGNVVFGALAIYIKTLNGDVVAKKDDIIIRDASGEIYTCKPDIFEKTYEKVED